MGGHIKMGRGVTEDMEHETSAPPMTSHTSTEFAWTMVGPSAYRAMVIKHRDLLLVQ